MAHSIDFNALKARTMGSSNDEEAVTVDTRGLISKVLSRYSGKWTVLREMIQNAADASATRVTVKFETLPSTTVPLPTSSDATVKLKHVVTHHTLRRLIISNNGHAFTEKDWARLKKIADGNPDETKIGAFGVGFYSVFDDCEEPFVSSGNAAMAFYWKGNSLFTRRLDLSGNDASPDTTFALDYRNNSSPVPSLLELARFLATSLTFVGLKYIDMWIDDWNLLNLTKKVAPSEKVTIPRDIETKTAEGLMKVVSVTREIAQVDAEWMKVVEWSPQSTLSARLDGLRDTTSMLRSFFSRFTGSTSSAEQPAMESTHKQADGGELTARQKASVFLHINTATVQPSISSSLSSELERATRKPPPKRTTIAILTPSYSTDTVSEESKILSSVLPSKSGRIFIGFPTHQTTGLNAHISAPSVIPTVERESIDLNTRYISRWNIEMLRAAGIVCRIAWTVDMSSIKTRIAYKSGPKIRKDDIMPFIPEAIHTANQFSFRESTPSATLGQTIEDSFWMCNKNASIEILSTCGVLPSHHVRIAPKDLSFMEGIPSLPNSLVENAKDFIKKLMDVGLVTEVTVSDIKKELENSALTSTQLAEFVSWIGQRAASGENDQQTTASLLNAAVANEESSGGQTGRLLTLATVQFFLNPTRIPSDLPVPPSVIPFKYTKSLEHHQLKAIGWTELQIVPWLRWLVENAGNRAILSLEHDITSSSSFASQILPVVSKQWDTLSQASKQTVINLLQPHTVIPVKNGMRKPEEAYFPSVRLFDDLPVVFGLSNVKDKFLVALGVRKTVELGVIFERLLDEPDPTASSDEVKPKWSHADLIKYLTSVRDDIPPKDIKRLKNTKICLVENSTTRHRYTISELFEPKESHRKLGLLIIDWPGALMPHSKEAQFLYNMGLKRHPSAIEVIEIMAKAALAGDTSLQDKAMAYFITEFHANKYNVVDMNGVTTPFLPIDGSQKLSTPNNCFTHEGAAQFGFNILRRDLHPHAQIFGVREHPPMIECVQAIFNASPKTPSEARSIFAYMALRIPELKQADISRLSESRIVPIPNETVSEKKISMRYVSPKNCYLGESEDFKDIFDFVAFGQMGNLFLQAVGSKQQPTKVEVAQMLVKEPARISSRFQSPEKYLNLLRSLAENLSTLKRHKDLFREMMQSPFLLASKELPASISGSKASQGSENEAEEMFVDDEQGIKEWRLVVAKDAVIVDDYQSYTLFKERVFAAPQEESLERFYASLGTPILSTQVEERANWGSKSSDQSSAARLQKIISERTRLFLHEHGPESVKHDTKWLEKHLSIVAVQSISLRRSLKNTGATHSQKRHAIITSQGSDCTLWIIPGKYDFYEISQALVHVLLARPKLHSILTLEMLLKTDLYELRARGYNVERILQKKQMEARIAEDLRQRELEEERRHLQEREVERLKIQDQFQSEEDNVQQQNTMPGVFPDSPSNQRLGAGNHTEAYNDGSQSRGLFSNLSKRLGLDDNKRPQNPLQSLFKSRTAHEDNSLTSNNEAGPPPPYSENDSGNRSQNLNANPNEPKTVSSPSQLHNNLLSAISACRPHGASGVYNRPATTQVSETKSYCDERPSHDLEYTATLSSRIHFLCAKSVTDKSAFLSDNAEGINAFAKILVECASVFSVRLESISIFYDPAGKTIAFNRSGSLFCNYLFFKQLHQARLLQDPIGGRADALVYWWVILCHELAHNLVEDHSSDHSFYTEGFVTQYFSKVAEKLLTQGPEASN